MHVFSIIEVDVDPERVFGARNPMTTVCFAVKTGPGYSLAAFGGWLDANSRAVFNFPFVSSQEQDVGPSWRIVGEVTTADTVEALVAAWEEAKPGYKFNNLLCTQDGHSIQIDFKAYELAGVLERIAKCEDGVVVKKYVFLPQIETL